MTSGGSGSTLVKLWTDRFMEVDLPVDDEHSLATAVAIAAQRTFLMGRVEVAWLRSRRDAPWTFTHGVRIDQLDHAAVALKEDMLSSELRAPLELQAIETKPGHARAGRAQSDGGVDFRLRWPEEQASVELRLKMDQPLVPSTEEEASDTVLRLCRPIEDLLELVFLLRPLHRLARQAAEQQIRHRLETLERSTRTFEVDEEPELQVHLTVAREAVSEGGALVDSCAPTDLPRVISAIERVGRVALHRVLGRAGPRPTVRRRTAAQASRTQVLLQALTRELQVFERTVAPMASPASPLLRLSFHRRVLSAVAEPQKVDAQALIEILEPISTEDVRDSELRLLAAWAMLHQRMVDGRPRGPGRAQDELGQLWEFTSRTTRRALPPILALWTTDVPAGRRRRRTRDPFHVRTVRNWLHLWFAWDLLDPALIQSPGNHLRSESWQLRCSIALMFRECLLYKLHGGEPGYVDRPAWILEALGPLVDHHVRLGVGIDREQDIRGHLQHVGDPAHPRGAAFASGHLQHILDVYLLGHFLLGAQVTGRRATDSTPVPLLDLLATPAGRPTSSQRQDLRRVWSLAALYHDVGLTLFPEYRPSKESIRSLETSIAKGLRRTRTALAEAGAELATTARDELVSAGVLRREPTSSLARWIDRQIEEGSPDHALTGAWYLHRAAAAVPAARAEIAREAALAVLLHGAPGEQVSADKSPAAALLVLCDALFDWQPGVGVDASRPERSGPPPGRIASLRFPDLQVAVTDSDEPDLRVTLAIPPDATVLTTGGAPCWPRVVVTHAHPAHLGEQVFPIWIAIAQNIGRLTPSSAGFAPMVEVRGRVPSRVRRTAESTAHLLETVLLAIQSPWRARLQVWLSHELEGTAVGGIDTTDSDSGPVEWRLIYPFPRAIARDDLRRYFPQLHSVANHVLLGWDVAGSFIGSGGPTR